MQFSDCLIEGFFPWYHDKHLISDVGPEHKAPPPVATQLVVPTQLRDDLTIAFLTYFTFAVKVMIHGGNVWPYTVSPWERYIGNPFFLLEVADWEIMKKPPIG